MSFLTTCDVLHMPPNAHRFCLNESRLPCTAPLFSTFNSFPATNFTLVKRSIGQWLCPCLFWNPYSLRPPWSIHQLRSLRVRLNVSYLLLDCKQRKGWIQNLIVFSQINACPSMYKCMIFKCLDVIPNNSADIMRRLLKEPLVFL